MSEPTSNFPQVRTVTSLVRNMLADEPIGPGFPFIPLTIASDGAGNCSATFGVPPGFIADDMIIIAGFNNNQNGTFPLTSGAGTQITWQNAAAAAGQATITSTSTIQGYGTGKKYTDTLLMPFVNSAYRGIQRALRGTGSTEFRVGQAFVTIPGLTFTEPSTQVILGFTGLTISSDADPAPVFDVANPLGQLPATFLMPRKLWERPTGSQNNFCEMVNLTNSGGLASRPQNYTLSSWEWIGDGIAFIGAQQDNDIKFEFDIGLPAVSDGAAQLLVLNSEDYHAFTVASMVEPSRGGKNTQSYDSAAEDAKEKLIQAATRGQQMHVSRSRAFSSRRGVSRRWY